MYTKKPIFGLTQEWFSELSFSRLEYGVHDKLHISSADEGFTPNGAPGPGIEHRPPA